MSSANEEEKGDPMIPYKVFQVNGVENMRAISESSIIQNDSMP